MSLIFSATAASPLRSQNAPISDAAIAAIEQGLRLRSQQQTSAAIAEFDRALELAPTAAEAYVAKAALLYQQGRSMDAIVLYDQALQQDQSSLAAYLGKGQTLARQGKREEAKTLLRTAQQAFRSRNELAKADAIAHLLPNL